VARVDDHNCPDSYELNSTLNYRLIDKKLSRARSYVVATPLFGLTSQSPVGEAYFLIGVDFEPFRGGSSKGQEGEEEPVPTAAPSAITYHCPVQA
jgi:hypothetical protein